MTAGLDPDASLRELVAGGETFTVEFKGEERQRLPDAELVEAVVCLANGAGGTLLVGVEDDGRVSGARPRHGAVTDPVRVQAVIANSTLPPLSTRVETVHVHDLPVLLVEVPESPRPVGTTRGRYVRRALGGDGRPTCLPFYTHEMLAREIDRGAADYAALPLRDATWDDLDRLEIERYRRFVRESPGLGDSVLAELSDGDLVAALGLATGNGPEPGLLTGALLLFGRPSSLQRFLPTHEVAFQVLRGLQVEVNDFFRWPLLRVAEELLGRFRARNPEQELQVGLFRVPVAAYSEVAFREALANALVHRDYTVRAAVHVQWNEDALEVTSPGGFPPGIRLDNLLVVPPRPRSPLLADAFKRAGIVERTGRGINRMFMEQLRVGRAAPDYGRTTGDTVAAVLPGGEANFALLRWVTEQEQAGQHLTLGELQILDDLLRERHTTTKALAQVLQRTEAETRGQLQRLVARGVVERRGEGRSVRWHLSAAAYRVLAEPSAYVRVRGFEPLQHEQMVLAYVEAHGRITRSQTAQLCLIAPPAATRLLARLVEQGRLQRVGERRGSYYVQPVAPAGQERH